MGGSAFSSGESPLLTPRMPQPVYDAVKQRCTAVLAELYHCVGTPLEGPGKVDYGDVDVLVACPRDEGADSPASTLDALRAITAALGATRALLRERAPSSLALPWPSTAADDDGGDGHGGAQRHVQVDVLICDSAAALRWLLFKQAHGDLWNMLGAVVRPYGLTADDGALWLRVAEIEPFDRARAKVRLTRDPDRVLNFLGLPAARYWAARFASPDDLYEYVAQCRLFWVAPHAEAADEAATAAKLKSNDRRRLRQRPLFRGWVDDFLPRCRAAGRLAAAPPTTRARITAEAQARFADAAPTFAARRAAFLQERQALALRADVLAPAAAAAPVPGDAPPAVAALYRACLAKALRAVVLEGDASYSVVAPADLRGDDGFFRVDRVVAFVEGCRDGLGAAALERHRQGFDAHRGRVAAKRG